MSKETFTPEQKKAAAEAVMDFEASAFLDSPLAQTMVFGQENFDKITAAMKKHNLICSQEGYRRAFLLCQDEGILTMKPIPPTPQEIAAAQAAEAARVEAIARGEAEALLAEFYSKSNARSAQGPSEVQRWLKVENHQARVDAALQKYGTTIARSRIAEPIDPSNNGRSYRNKEVRSDATTVEAQAIRDVQEGMQNLHKFLNTPDKVVENVKVPFPPVELNETDPAVQSFMKNPNVTGKQIQSWANARRRHLAGQ